MVVQNLGQVAANAYHQTQRDSQREQLVNDHLEYAKQVISSMLASLPTGVDTENLEGAALFGLIEAAGKFDQSRNIAFKTFAYPRIRGAVFDELRRNSPLPQKMLKQISQIREVIESMSPPIDLRRVGQLTGLSEVEVEQSLAAMKICAPQSWDEIGRVIPDTHPSTEEDPAVKVEREEMVSRMASLIQKLPERQRNVLMMYYMEEMRLKEIGEVLNISESRTSRVLAEAQVQLKALLDAEPEPRSRRR